jgi:hypothetical protein
VAKQKRNDSYYTEIKISSFNQSGKSTMSGTLQISNSEFRFFKSRAKAPTVKGTLDKLARILAESAEAR